MGAVYSSGVGKVAGFMNSNNQPSNNCPFFPHTEIGYAKNVIFSDITVIEYQGCTRTQNPDGCTQRL